MWTALCKHVLKVTHVAPADVTDVVLVGGSSRVPYLQDELKELFHSRSPRAGINPDEAVAVGAALFADSVFNESESTARAACVLRDVTSLDLGVATDRDEFSVILPCNTPWPTSRTKAYTTTSDDQVLEA
jgi:molecular chaperone DnaK (HSP70)